MTTSTTPPAEITDTVRQYATQLARPSPAPTGQPWQAQSLTTGAAGIALLHIERAHTGHGTWQQAHQWVTSAAAGQISATDTTGLYLGAPATAFMLDTAVGSSERYRDALATLDTHILALTHRRAERALARIRAGAPATFREYDVFFGLTGIGALLLRRAPGSSAMERVLDYLVALTRPLRIDGQTLPGWWVGHDPHRRQSARFPGGHANLGMAHGAAGPLAVLGQATRRGITVDGQPEAITALSAWLDAWRQDSATGPWWPQWITRAEARTGHPRQPGPARPSWCYGTPGIARAQQIAAIAIGNTERQHQAEHALARCLDDPIQRARLTDAGLCHGWAGVYQTVWRAAQDGATSALRTRLPDLVAHLGHHAHSAPAAGAGLLEGAAGTALVLHTAARDTAPTSGWDACLLIDAPARASETTATRRPTHQRHPPPNTPF